MPSIASIAAAALTIESAGHTLPPRSSNCSALVIRDMIPSQRTRWSGSLSGDSLITLSQCRAMSLDVESTRFHRIPSIGIRKRHRGRHCARHNAFAPLTEERAKVVCVEEFPSSLIVVVVPRFDALPVQSQEGGVPPSEWFPVASFHGSLQAGGGDINPVGRWPVAILAPRRERGDAVIERLVQDRPSITDIDINLPIGSRPKPSFDLHVCLNQRRRMTTPVI